MYKYFINDIALLELRDVESVYVSYFARIGDMQKGIDWAQQFYANYRKAIEEIKENPMIHGVCRVFPFDCVDTEYRSFTVGWFTIFYTVGKDDFTVWHIRSSKSDFRTITRR